MTRNNSGDTKVSRRRIAGERTAARSEQARPAPGPAGPDGSREAPTRELSTVSTPAGAVEQEPAAPEASTGTARRRGRGPSNLLLAVLAVLAAVVVAAAAYFAVPAWRAQAVQRAQQSAPSAAERAAKAILSYDYTSLDRDEKTAAGFMTPSYRNKYEHTFRLVRANAPRLKAKVSSQVLESGVAEADADHAHVLVFVNQTTKSTANPGQPQVALNRVMFDMVRQHGRWLVNGITAY